MGRKKKAAAPNEAGLAGIVDGILACVRHDPDIEKNGAEATAREHILSGLRMAWADGYAVGLEQSDEQG